MDSVELTKRLVSVPSLSGDEGAAAAVVEEAMHAAGFREIRRTPLGAVFGVIGSESPTRVLFDGHIDVVPPAGQWTRDPFTPTMDGDRLYGRGTTDMKAGVAAAIVGISSVAERLQGTVGFSATVLEETVEGVALSEVLAELSPEAVVICEPSAMQLKIAQRGRIELLLQCAGRTAHAAHPEKGSNPIEHMATAIEALRQTEPPSDAQLGEGILVPTDIITDPYPSISLIPSSVEVRFDRRTLPGEDAAEILSQIVDVAEMSGPGHFTARATADPVTSYTGMTINPERVLSAWRTQKHELVKAGLDAMTSAGLHPDVGVWGFCTNGSESAGNRGLPTIGFGPGHEDNAHIQDEFVSISEIRAATSVYSYLALRLASQGEDR